MPPHSKPPRLNGTQLIHGDSGLAGPEVAPSLSVTTTFRAPNPLKGEVSDLNDLRNPVRHVYSRYTQQVGTRVEHILSQVNDGFALTYSSGLSASYAALIFYCPKRIAIRGGYHGCHATIDVYKKAKGLEVEIIDLDAEYRHGDLCWLETPLNPTGESRDIQYYADKVHKVGGKLLVDSTFGPPPLQYPFRFGADIVLHSGTKYLGGHSDLLAGVLVVKTLDEWNTLHSDRTFLGSMMGSLESWLLLRSLRTLHLRVPRQSASATVLAQWLNSIAKTSVGETYDGIPGGVLSTVWHSSLQGKDARGFDPSKQMLGGWNATFSILFSKPEYALKFPHLLKYFVPATSLGGVESLVEHRIQSDPSSDPCLVRLSIGVEDVEDLKADLKQALVALSSEILEVLIVSVLSTLLILSLLSWHLLAVPELRWKLAEDENQSHSFSMPSLSSKRLYLRGVPKNTTCEDLDKYLSCYGRITEVKVLPNCAFVQFEFQKDALVVLETFRKQPFLGKHIIIEFAHPLRKDMALETTDDRVSKIRRSAPQGSPRRFTVLVTDIPRGIRWQELKDFGRLSGSLVAFCDIDRYGNGFIEYFTHEDAKRAVTALDGRDLGGRRVHVEEHHSNSEFRTRYRTRSRSPLRRSTSDRSQDNDHTPDIKDERRLSVDGWASPSSHAYDYAGHRPEFPPSHTGKHTSSHNDREPYTNSEIGERACSWSGSCQDYRRGHFQDLQYTSEGFYDNERSRYSWHEDKNLHSMDPYLQ